MKKIGRLLFGFLFFLTANSAFAKVFCVDTAEEIQAALTTAASNAQDDEVKIVQGTYVGNFVYATAAEAFDLAIEGGYNSNCTSQTLNSSNTILDGNQAGSVLAISAGELNVNFDVKGLTLRNGKRPSGDGGGLYAAVGNDGSIGIDSCAIENNNANDYGGGISIWANSAIVNITNSNIIDNSGGSGGGFYINAESGAVALKSNNITQNHAVNGAGGGAHINATSSTVVFSDNYISRNSSTHSYMTSYGGGIYLSHGNTSSSSYSFINNTFFGNGTSGIGGGLSIHSDYLYLNESSISLTNNNITGNEASNGGGISIDAVHSFANNSTITFKNNSIENNTGRDFGGGIYLGAQTSIHGNSSFAFINNNIRNNTANSYGAGIYASTSLGTIMFTNNNFVNNATSMFDTSYGGGLYLVLGSNEQNSLGEFYNNLFWNNSANNTGSDFWIDNDGNDNFQSTPITLLANNFNRTPGAGYYILLPVTIDSSNLNNIDPHFIDADNGDLHLQPGSPMIDAGYPATPGLPLTDLAGGLRVVGGVVDIGAYEYHEYEFCDANQLTLDNEDIGPGGDNYSSEVGISTHGSVNISYDADVVLTAPVIQLNPGLKVESGAQLLLRAQSVTCPLLVMACGVEK